MAGKTVLFLLGNLPSGVFGAELGQEDERKGVGDYGKAPHFLSFPCMQGQLGVVDFLLSIFYLAS